MGSINEMISFESKNEKLVKIFIEKFFSDMNPYLLYKSSKDFVEKIQFLNDKYIINLEKEPIFCNYEDCDKLDGFFIEFAKKYQDYDFEVCFCRTFGNCGDTLLIKYTFDSNTKEAKIISLYSDIDALYDCTECEEEFEEPLIRLEDYNGIDVFTCPYCGEELWFDVDQNIKIIKIGEKNE